jgi:protein-S-isoprenylcysteine O-methyltransferase Ste14
VKGFLGMDEFRYILGIVIIVIMPVVITFWVVIHGGSKVWRKRSPEMAYSVAGFFIVIAILLAISFRSELMGRDLGFNLLFFIVGALIYISSFVLWRPVKRHLDFKTFAGVPEITNTRIELIQDGPFSIVRHPRYLMVAIGVAGWCLMSHYAGVYLVGILSIVGLFLVVRLEEKDLLERFGDDYRAYQKRVPQMVPTIAGIKQFWHENFS